MVVIFDVQDFHALIDGYLNQSVRVTHAQDIVPSLPAQILGYHHFAREVWQLPEDKRSDDGGGDPHVDGAGMKFRVCDGSGEDPTCHNSACFLGLCRSIKDHLFYLGRHMYSQAEEC
jgi:hypothetical protein